MRRVIAGITSLNGLIHGRVENNMIYEVHGDILLSNAQAIAHGISPNENFDRGLAFTLGEMWPAMAQAYRNYAQQVHPKPGELWSWNGFDTKLYCLLTQAGSFDPGALPRRATIANVDECLQRLRNALLHENIHSLALPRLATGIGGLSWEDVRPLIEKHLGDLSIPVYVYSRYQAGTAAQEPDQAVDGDCPVSQPAITHQAPLQFSFPSVRTRKIVG